jgi:hypothetical protein
MTWRDAVTTLLLAAAAAAGGVSFGVPPALAIEVAATGTVVVLLVRLVRMLPPVRRRRRRRPQTVADPAAGARSVVAAALESDWGAVTRLRPVVRDMVATRRELLHGRAAVEREDLPPEVAALLAADRRPRPRTPGLSVPELDQLLTRLEEL